MSKAAKQSLIILIVLLLAALGFAVFSMLEKQSVEAEKVRVEQELEQTQEDFMVREKKYMQDTRKLSNDVKKKEEEGKQLQAKIKKIETETARQIKELSAQVEDITSDRDKWKRRIDTIRAERDKLMGKIADLTKKLEEKPEPQIVYKEAPPQPQQKIETYPKITENQRGDDAYWADVLKQKASLEVKIQELKDELSDKNIKIVELRQSNEDLQLKVETMEADREEIVSDAQHTSDMIDNLSLELARTKNDKKFISTRLEKITTENGELRQQLKKLVSMKNSLEKSIVRVNREKDKVEGKLGETETIIQSKIDEIWEIKDDLDRSIRSSQKGMSPSEVELPPIVVSSDGETAPMLGAETPSGFNGKVISINEANNFVIVDIGENDGIRLGDSLSVYRDSKYIARLEVIQVRKDISAADLKDQWSKVQVGDVIR